MKVTEAKDQAPRSVLFDIIEQGKPKAEVLEVYPSTGGCIRFRAVTNVPEIREMGKNATAWAVSILSQTAEQTDGVYKFKEDVHPHFEAFKGLDLQTLVQVYIMHTLCLEEGATQMEFARMAREAGLVFDDVRQKLDALSVGQEIAGYAKLIEDAKKKSSKTQDGGGS